MGDEDRREKRQPMDEEGLVLLIVGKIETRRVSALQLLR